MGKNQIISGVGLGLRKPFMDDLKKLNPHPIDFLEIAPENWMLMGGARKKQLGYFLENYPMICHGLSLSIGSFAELNMVFLKNLKKFLDKNNIKIYSEHLSYCSDQGQLYDLMPIPFTQDAVEHLVKRIKLVQDILERPLVLENISYYAKPSNELSELDFINQILEQSGCELLLDVNNIYVNSINHDYNPNEFLVNLRPNKISYIHIAGHYQQEENLLIDTHGADVIDPVWALLKLAYETFGVIPTLLERDSDIPSLDSLLQECEVIRSIQDNG